MAVDREFRIRFTGDATQLDDASKLATRGIDRLSDSTKENKQESEKATFSHRQMHQALHQISEKAPEVGIALRAMASGPAAGLVVLTVLLTKAKEGIENLDKSLTSSAWDTTKIDGIAKSIELAAIEAAKFAREMEAAAKAQQTIAEQAAAIAKIHAAEGSATDKVREAQRQFELEATESIKDPEERKRKQAEINLRYAMDKKQREDADSKFKTNESYREIANEELGQTHRAAQIEAARKRLAGLGSEKDIDTKIESEKARLEKTDKEIEEKQKRLEELQAKPWLRRSTPEQHEMTYLEQQLEQLGTLRGQQQRLVHGLEKGRSGKVIAIQSAQEELSGLESEQKASVQRTTKLRAELPTQTAVAGIEAQGRTQVTDLSIAGNLASHQITVQQAIGMIRQGTGNNVGSLIAALTELAQLMQGMQRQSPNSPEVQALWKAVNELRSQFIAQRAWIHIP
jgi:hypothetical protein